MESAGDTTESTAHSFEENYLEFIGPFRLREVQFAL